MFKGKSCVEEHAGASICSTEETDYFCIALKEIFSKIENIKEKIGKENQKSPSPRKYIEQMKKKGGKNVSNYQKYIKNIKHIKDNDSFTPPTIQDNKAKSSKYSFDPITSKHKTGEKDDSLSINLLKFNGSTNDLSFTSKVNKLPTETAEERKITENGENSLDKMINHVNIIQSKFSLMEEGIQSFANQTSQAREMLESMY